MLRSFFPKIKHSYAQTNTFFESTFTFFNLKEHSFKSIQLNYQVKILKNKNL